MDNCGLLKLRERGIFLAFLSIIAVACTSQTTPNLISTSSQTVAPTATPTTKINWEAVGAISTAFTGAVILVSVAFLARQLQELRRATHAQSFLEVSNRLQDEELRAARGQVFKLRDKPFEEWTADEIGIAEKVCSSYDLAGIVAQYEMLPKQLIVDNWGDSLRRLWTICRPLVEKYRIERDAPEFWDDFQWLAAEAENLARRRKRRRAG